jgi:hypothetical protein
VQGFDVLHVFIGDFGEVNVEALRFEDHFEQLKNGIVIVNDKDACRHARLLFNFTPSKSTLVEQPFNRFEERFLNKKQFSPST